MKRLIFLLIAILLPSISFGQKVEVKDSNNETLITINDEGINKSSITIQNSGSAPGILTDKLYNVGHSLFWNGTMLGTSGSSIWSLNGSNAYYNTGNVGIGTSTPLNKLHLVGDLRLEDASPHINFYSGSTQMGSIGFWTDNNLNIINRGATSPIVFATNAAEKMRITADGNVGIGTANPSEKLHVDFGNILIRGDTEGEMSLKYVDDDTGNNYEIGPSSSEELSFKVNGVERMNIAAGGKVGIGTMKLTGAFEDKDGDVGTAGQILSSTAIGTDWIAAPSGDSALWTINGNDIYYNTGNVGIGTIKPDANLHIEGTEGLLVQGTQSSGTTLNLGAGTRMHFYPKKSAFRAGYASVTQWDDANIGHYSTATGFGTTASGPYSTAIGIGTIAFRDASVAMGGNTEALGHYSTAMGYKTKATVDYSTAMGDSTTASGYASTAMGLSTTASGHASTAMGWLTEASGDNSTAMGIGTIASGRSSTAMGSFTNASGNYSTAIGWSTEAIGTRSTALGTSTDAIGEYATAMGYKTNASLDHSTAMGYKTIASGISSTSMGDSTEAIGESSTAMGYKTDAVGKNSTAMGSLTDAIGESSTAMGENTIASGQRSTAMGYFTRAIGAESTAMGKFSEASGNQSTAMGDNTTASGFNSTSMGYETFASGGTSTAMGDNTIASGSNSTAMGTGSIASGSYSTAMGSYTEASELGSTAMGSGTIASGFYSTAIGWDTEASGKGSTAMGYNVSTNGFDGSFIIGDFIPNNPPPLNSDAANQMTMRFAGGYRLFTDATATIGAVLYPNQTSWSVLSDSTRKENYQHANGDYFLNSIAKLKLGSWNYIGQSSEMRHYGPMAQEIYHYFGKDEYGTVGNDTTIISADMDGIMMIAIQALEKRTADLLAENQKIKKENDLLKQRLDAIEIKLYERHVN